MSCCTRALTAASGACILYYKLFVLQVLNRIAGAAYSRWCSACHTLCPVAIVMVVNMSLAPRTRDKERTYETDHLRR